MIDVDRDTERRTAWLQFLALAVGACALAWLVIGDHLMLLAFLPPLIVVLGCRAWAVERFSPTLAQHYARAVVSRSGDAIVEVLRSDPFLGGAWAAQGVDARITRLPPGVLARAMSALRTDRFPERRLPGLLKPVNRLAWTVLGTVLGVVASSCAIPVAALPWPAGLAVAAAIGFRLVVAVLNRRQIVMIAEVMRRDAHRELEGVLGNPFTARRAAVVAELNRLAARATGTADRRPPAELRVITVLAAAGFLAGLLAGLTTRTC